MPQTVIDLGRLVKSKYPSYADMSDADVGRRVRQAYPDYADFVDVSDQPEAPKPSIFQRIGNALSGAVNEQAEGERLRAETAAAEAGKTFEAGKATAKEGLKNIHTPGQRMRGASQIFRGTLQATSPVTLPLAAPAIAAGGMPAIAGAGLGLAAQEGIERGGKALANRLIAPEPPTMPKAPGEPPGMGRTGAEQAAGPIELAADIAGLGSFAGTRAKLAAKTGLPIADEAASGIFRPRPKEGPNIFPPDLPSATAEVRPAAEAMKAPELVGKSAAESADLFQSVPQPKSAAESAKIFERPIPANQAERRAAVEPISEGVPEEVLRVQDRREQLSQQLTGKAWQELNNPERLQIDEMLQGEGARVPKEIVPIKVEPRGGPFQRPGRQVSQARIQGQRGAVRGEDAQDIAGAFVKKAKTVLERSPGETVMDALGKLEDPGIEVYTGRLRESTGLSKPEFDQAVLDLAKKQKVFLAEHDHPNNISPADREALVQYTGPNGETQHFVAVSKRPEPRNPESGKISFSKAKKPIEEEYLNFKRVSLSPGEEQALRLRMQKMATDGTLSKDVEPHAAIVAEAAKIGPEALKNVMGDMPGQGLGGRAAMLAARDRQVEVTRELHQTLKLLDDQNLPVQQRETLQSKAYELQHNEQEYLKWTAGQKSEWARNLASLRIMANATTDLGVWVQRAKTALGLPPGVDLPESAMKTVRDLVTEAQNAAQAGNAKAADIAKGKLAQGVAQLTKSGPLETLTTLWKAGLLTAPPTHFVNVAGNAGFQTMEVASRIPGALTDMAVSILGGKRRTVIAPSIDEQLTAGIKAATDGVRQAAQVVKGGVSMEQLAKGEIPRELNTGIKAVDVYGQTPFRVLAAEDAVFKNYAMNSSLHQQARLAAINEVKTGKIAKGEIHQRAQQLLANPTEEMKYNAEYYARVATFNNPNAIAQGFKSLVSTVDRLSGPVAGPLIKTGAEFVVPFSNTPANLFARLLDYTPVGAAGRVASAATIIAAKKLGIQRFNNVMRPDMQRVFSEAVGRGSVGTALLYVGYRMGLEDEATGPRPDKNTGVRNVDRRTGSQPGSVKIGDTWYRTVAFLPGGALVAMGAAMAKEGTRKLTDEAKRPWNMVKIAGQAVLEQPMVQGPKEILDELENPSGKSFNKMISDKAGSFVPAIVSRVAAPLADPTVPDLNPPSDAGALGAAAYGIKSRIARGSVPPLVDVFGNKVESSRAGSLNPLRPSTDRTATDDLDAMLAETKVGIQSIARIPEESEKAFAERAAKQSGAIRRDKESDEEHRAHAIAAGGLIEEALRDKLTSLPADPDKRKAAVSKIVRRINADLSAMVKRNPDYLSMTPAERAEYLLSLPKQRRP